MPDNFGQQMLKNNKIWASRSACCLSKWYPLIEGLVPTPKTKIIKTDVQLVEIFDGVRPKGMYEFLGELLAAVAAVGLPAFIRTGQTSAKHDWERTCYLTDPHDLEQHVCNIVEYSEMVDLIGLDSSVWVVREYLPTAPAFYAFSGRMPITKERRYFVSNGKVICQHPYWPAGALAEGNPSEPNWRALLVGLNDVVDVDEVKHLTDLTEKVGRAVGGAWSVDWLWTPRGWYLTDMALAVGSYHWPGCENEGMLGGDVE